MMKKGDALRYPGSLNWYPVVKHHVLFVPSPSLILKIRFASRSFISVTGFDLGLVSVVIFYQLIKLILELSQVLLGNAD